MINKYADCYACYGVREGGERKSTLFAIGDFMPRRVVHAAEVRPAWVPCRRQSFESSYFAPKNCDATGDGWRCGLGNGSGRVDQGWVLGWVAPANVPTLSPLTQLCD